MTSVMTKKLTKEELIAAAKKLSSTEQQEIAEALWEAYELTEAGKQELEARWSRMEEHPEESLSLQQLKEHVEAYVGR